MSKQDLNDMLNRIRSGEESLQCAMHGYTPSRGSKQVSKPGRGCADCWRVLYWTIYANAPDEERTDFAEGLEMAVRHTVELHQKGQWDYVPKLEISIGKE